MTRDVEGVAKGLTEAQRRALLKRHPLTYGQRLIHEFEGFGVMAADAYGLADFTPFGLALKTHLLAQDKSQ